MLAPKAAGVLVNVHARRELGRGCSVRYSCFINKDLHMAINLHLVNASRRHLEEEAVRLAFSGTNEELHAAVAKLSPKGQLRVVTPSSSELASSEAPAELPFPREVS